MEVCALFHEPLLRNVLVSRTPRSAYGGARQSRDPQASSTMMGPGAAAHRFTLRCVRGTTTRSRGALRPSFADARPSNNRGRGESRVLAAPAASHAKMKKHTSGSHHRFDRAGPGLPRASGFTVSFVLSPETWLCCLRRRRDAKHRHQLDTCLGVSGPHDFAVRADVIRLTTSSRPSHPALNVRDDAQRPSDRGGMGWNSHRIDEEAKPNIFAHGTGRPKSA